MKPEQIVNEALTSPIYKLLQETPLQPARRLSELIGNQLLLKREDALKVFSFKVRGASHKMLKLSERERQRGVVAASAGNHAQGVAFAARSVGVPAHIFIPQSTPDIKVEAVRSMGANTIIGGKDITETLANAQQFAREKKLPFFHPFDDYKIICGQATVGVELLREIHEPVEAVFVGCGGGGLLAGVATVIKQLRPKIKVIGVEPDDAGSMTLALRKGRPTTLPYVGTFADTVAVARVGAKTFKLCKQFVDSMILVDSGSICNAIKEIYEDTRIIAEPAGALSVAAARQYAKSSKYKGGRLVAILSGANMDFDKLRYVLERTYAGHTEEMLLGAQIPERPGSFLRFYRLLDQRNITEFSYRYSHKGPGNVLAGISISDASERKQILAKLRKNGIKSLDLSGEEHAQIHVRHMVGGRAVIAGTEQVYLLEFSERAGALNDFLVSLEPSWNISMFHYRSLGGIFAKILIGFQLPSTFCKELEKRFKRTCYSFQLINDSPSYRWFLADPSRKS